ncbi:hypothetical protein EYF80_009883 [Liparis tanakae]|uniref:Uncharacterized protein n=1 Tax=Liparis tanakae TaxID=230148 RepID=A0A4Z2IPQ0_9TELE|nr:hypothetical protein EYF80_009883 [Liparis tanakae]
MSSSPLSSRVQWVLGPSPSTRVCLQDILFSDTQACCCLSALNDREIILQSQAPISGKYRAFPF